MSMMDVAASVCLFAGIAFVLLAALGLWRFDDVFSRIHAATKAVTLGMVLVIVAAALRMENEADVLKLLLAGMLQWISAPVSGHMLGRAAYRSGTEPTPHMAIDQLSSERKKENDD